MLQDDRFNKFVVYGFNKIAEMNTTEIYLHVFYNILGFFSTVCKKCFWKKINVLKLVELKEEINKYSFGCNGLFSPHVFHTERRTFFVGL